MKRWPLKSDDRSKLPPLQFTPWQQRFLEWLRKEWVSFANDSVSVALCGRCPETVEDLKELAATLGVDDVNHVENAVQRFNEERQRQKKREAANEIIDSDRIYPIGRADKTDKKTDKSRTDSRVPRNPRVGKLLRELRAKRNQGKTQIDIAKELTNGDEKDAENLLRQTRRFR